MKVPSVALVNHLANRKGIVELGPINSTVPIFDDRTNSKSPFPTPNNNTPYTWFWLDLRGGPLVLEVPPNALGLIDDMGAASSPTSASSDPTRAKEASI